MARTSDDTWDLSESVGATALGTAEWRAKEATNENPLFTDPYAQIFLDVAVARGMSYSQYTDDMMARLWEIDPSIHQQLSAQWSYTSSRTKWFDDFFTEAGGAGVRQAVILAAGLDARAWRLPWATDTAVFEIDQPKVLEFKTETLHSHGAEPVCRYIAVGFDLRHDWPKALCDVGFDPTRPAAWSAEGLLAYLPSDAQDLLFDRIHALSAAGSRIACDVFGAAFFDPENLARLSAWFDHLRQAVIQAGGQVPDTPSMWFDEERTDAADWLREHGWKVEAIEIHDLMARYGREASGVDAAGIPACDLISGRLA
jgi:methyltransferase (TIGR00027 family)